MNNCIQTYSKLIDYIYIYIYNINIYYICGTTMEVGSPRARHSSLLLATST